MERREIDGWRLTAIVMVVVSTVIALYEWSGNKIFLDPFFTVCVVYIPTLVSVIIYFAARRAGGCFQV